MSPKAFGVIWHVNQKNPAPNKTNKVGNRKNDDDPFPFPSTPAHMLKKLDLVDNSIGETMMMIRIKNQFNKIQSHILLGGSS